MTQASSSVEGNAVIEITGIKVFSATKARERERLGEHITSWIHENPALEIIDKIVTQSSDSEFHCLTITLFYRNRRPRSAPTTPRA